MIARESYEVLGEALYVVLLSLIKERCCTYEREMFKYIDKPEAYSSRPTLHTRKKAISMYFSDDVWRCRDLDPNWSQKERSWRLGAIGQDQTTLLGAVMRSRR